MILLFFNMLIKMDPPQRKKIQDIELFKKHICFYFFINLRNIIFKRFQVIVFSSILH